MIGCKSEKKGLSLIRSGKVTNFPLPIAFWPSLSLCDTEGIRVLPLPYNSCPGFKEVDPLTLKEEEDWCSERLVGRFLSCLSTLEYVCFEGVCFANIIEIGPFSSLVMLWLTSAVGLQAPVLTVSGPIKSMTLVGFVLS